MAVDDVTQAYQQIADIGINAPNPMQCAVWDAIRNGEWGVSLLLKGPTGSGKTEAISVPALAMGDTDRRLIMVYPTRSLVDDQIGRFERMLTAQSRHVNRPLTLVIDTGAESVRRAWRGGDEIPLKGNTRRHLYHGDVIITTLDKLLYRYFGFGEPGKSYTFPLRIHYGTRRTLICFDEAHSYDEVAFTNFNRLVKMLYTKGNDVALMTATMPRAFAEEFDYLDCIDFVEDEANRRQLADFTRDHFPDRKHPKKRLTYLPDKFNGEDEASPAIQTMIRLAQQHHAPDRRLIVTAERVRDAVTIYRALQAALPQAEPLLYHGRLTAKRRKEVYRSLLESEKQDKGYLLISTSAIEVGCDLNAHTLITQLCDPERLIQRAGRCNRKQEMADAEVIVVGDVIPEWLTGLDVDGLRVYRETLAAQNGKSLDVPVLTACIQKRTNLDYRIEMMFDMLYEYVYEAKLENKGLHDRGLVVTRSWEPSIVLCVGYDEKKGSLKPVEVPMSRCVAKDGEPLSAMWLVVKETFDRRERKPNLEPLGGWQCAYAADIIAYPQPGFDTFDDSVGYVELPKLFNKSYPSGYRRVLVREEDEQQKRVWYLDRQRADIEKLVAEEAPAEEEGEGEGDDAN